MDSLSCTHPANSITLNHTKQKAIAEIKLLNWIHMLKFSHKHLISVFFFFLFSLSTTKQTKKEKKTKAKKTEENNEIDACSSAF